MRLPQIDQHPPDSTVAESVLDQLADALVSEGYAVVDDLFDPLLIQSLRTEFDRPDCQFKTAGIGRDQAFIVARDIRGDRICWLEGQSLAATRFLGIMGQIQIGLNQRLFMGLFDYESHLAFYPVGTFYKKHLDAFKGRSNRVLSTVLYLNTQWDCDAGGELVLYTRADDAVLQRVVPLAGRLVVFLSEDFPHEVLPATRERYSIAGWFRVNTNTAGVVDPPE